MTVSVREYGKYSMGGDRDIPCHEFTGSGNSFVYKKSTTGTVYGPYLTVTMWEDLINYGPYNYEVEIRINRKQ